MGGAEGYRWKDVDRAHPKEFRDDVVALARKGDASIGEVARDFGIIESCLRNWLSKADVEDGRRPGVPQAESAEPHELRRRNRLSEQENEVLRPPLDQPSGSPIEFGTTYPAAYPA